MRKTPARGADYASGSRRADARGDELVSRAHAQLLVVPDGIRLEDLGSRHRTIVNGQPLTGPRLLTSGDVISIGDALLVVHRPVRASAGRAVLERAIARDAIDVPRERVIVTSRAAG